MASLIWNLLREWWDSVKALSAFSCECYLLVFCRFRSKAVDEFVTLVFCYPAWPGSSLCHLVGCVTLSVRPSLSLVSPHPSYSLVLLLQQQRPQTGHTRFSSLTASGDPSVPSKVLGTTKSSLCGVGNAAIVHVCLWTPKKEYQKESTGSSVRPLTFTVGLSPTGFEDWTYDEDWLLSLG